MSYRADNHPHRKGQPAIVFAGPRAGTIGVIEAIYGAPIRIAGKRILTRTCYLISGSWHKFEHVQPLCSEQTCPCHNDYPEVVR